MKCRCYLGCLMIALAASGWFFREMTKTPKTDDRLLPNGAETPVTFRSGYVKPMELDSSDYQMILGVLRRVNYHGKIVAEMHVDTYNAKRSVRIQVDDAYVLIAERSTAYW